MEEVQRPDQTKPGLRRQFLTATGDGMRRLLPLAWPLFPVVIGTILIELLGPLGGPFSAAEGDLFDSIVDPHPFLPGMLSMIAVLVVHVCVCCVGFWVAYRMAWIVSGGVATVTVAALAGFAIAGLLVAGAKSGWSIYEVSYLVFERLYADTQAANAFTTPRMFGLSALQLAIIVPVGLGIVGVTMMCAAANEQLRLLGRRPGAPDEGYEATLEAVRGRLMRCLYLLSIGLVTSTVAASLFFHLPAKLSQRDLAGGAPFWSEADAGTTKAAVEGAAPDPKKSLLLHADQKLLAGIKLREELRTLRRKELAPVQQRLEAFGAELSIFWGVVFTLVLFGAAGVPMLRLQQKVRDYSGAIGNSRQATDARKRLSEAGLLSDGFGQVKLLLALLAPLATGPISNFAQVALGS